MQVYFWLAQMRGIWYEKKRRSGSGASFFKERPRIPPIERGVAYEISAARRGRGPSERRPQTSVPFI